VTSPTPPTPRTPFERLAEVARPSGAFAMLAMDQRESLRAMFAERIDGPIDVDRRIAFKVSVARILSSHASALLVDAAEGLEPILDGEALAEGCGLIVAADELLQPTGMPVDDTGLDLAVDLDEMARRGASAAKLLVIWRPDRDPAARSDLVRAFIERSHAAGLAAIVEGVLRPPPGIAESAWTEREAALLEATRELGSHGPDLYKAQVPFDGREEPEAIREACAVMSAALPCPWVVLSSGVAIDDFPPAVEAACRGGASGFLAGRAVWRDAIGPDPEPMLRDRSVPRLRRLGEIVDAAARPWHEAPRPA
jgi:sulfofructosephosphate aldolase